MVIEIQDLDLHSCKDCGIVVDPSNVKKIVIEHINYWICPVCKKQHIIWEED